MRSPLEWGASKASRVEVALAPYAYRHRITGGLVLAGWFTLCQRWIDWDEGMRRRTLSLTITCPVCLEIRWFQIGAALCVMGLGLGFVLGTLSTYLW